jgi:hypothetical protein
MNADLILIVIPRSSAAAGTRHGQASHEDHGSPEMPRSSAAIGSFTRHAGANMYLKNGLMLCDLCLLCGE